MPKWVKITTAGLLCVICTSLVFKALDGYKCTNKNCPTHDDEPPRQNTGIPLKFEVRASLGTTGTSNIDSALIGATADDFN